MADKWHEIRDGYLYTCSQADGAAFLYGDRKIHYTKLCPEEDIPLRYPDARIHQAGDDDDHLR